MLNFIFKNDLMLMAWLAAAVFMTATVALYLHPNSSHGWTRLTNASAALLNMIATI